VEFWGENVVARWAHSLVAISERFLVVFGGGTIANGKYVTLSHTLVIDLTTLNPATKSVSISEVDVQGPSARAAHTCVAIENEMIL
jgi:Galactose oxidase, central domain